MDGDFLGVLREAHPWWAGKGMGRDLHLRRLQASPIRWDPPVLAAIPLRNGDTHTLRGPRQAGKTTTVKRLIKQLVDRGESRILYHSFDLGGPPEVILDIIRAAKRLHPEPDGPWYLFLDEITSVPDWQVGIKVAWDSGLTADDSILLTASSAHDLKRGAERLPGRRGKGHDYLQLPMSFRDFCTSAHGITFDDEPLAAEEFLTERGHRATTRLMSQADKLAAAFGRYLLVGGFPAAVGDHVAANSGEVSPETLQALWEIIAGDITKSRRDVLAAVKLVDAIGTALGSTLSWQSATRAMGFETPATAKEYAEFLAESFALLAVYYWDISKRSLEPSKQRKIYWMDLALGQIPRLMIPGARTAPQDGVVENAVAIALFRCAAQTLIQANAIPGSIAYWRSSGDREVDFVVPRITDIERERLPVEVKGDNETGLNGARQAIRQRFSQGLVLSRTKVDWRPDIATLPVWVFLAGLCEQTRRTITLG
jgi:predicted AAA+ superfamily ATPase